MTAIRHLFNTLKMMLCVIVICYECQSITKHYKTQTVIRVIGRQDTDIGTASRHIQVATCLYGKMLT